MTFLNQVLVYTRIRYCCWVAIVGRQLPVEGRPSPSLAAWHSDPWLKARRMAEDAVMGHWDSSMRMWGIYVSQEYDASRGVCKMEAWVFSVIDKDTMSYFETQWPRDTYLPIIRAELTRTPSSIPVFKWPIVRWYLLLKYISRSQQCVHFYPTLLILLLKCLDWPV